jgi:NAD(P)-dependent dehydrogenase (short-subunit alcohol dehydrogenase family)
MYGYPPRRAIVTGAAHGIGKAIARRLAAEACDLALWDIDFEALEAIRAELTTANNKIVTQRVDVADLSAVKLALQEATRQWNGDVDILVNNAGIGQASSILDSTPEDFDLVLNVNVRGTFNCSHVVAPAMSRRGSGLIINMASWFGKSGRPMALAYCASKFAIIGMTQSMAIDLASHGIRVNAICPGAIADTRMRDQADVAARAKGLPSAAERTGSIPLGRLGEPDDVAKMVAFLLSNEASYMTGQSINVTGGLWMN